MMNKFFIGLRNGLIISVFLWALIFGCAFADWFEDAYQLMITDVEVDIISDLIAHYKMNDNVATTTVVDAIGSHNGTSVRNTNLMSATGKINDALTFDGADDKIDCQSDFILTNTCSITAWIYPTGWGENNHGVIVENGKFIFTVRSTNNTLRLSSDFNTNVYSATSSISLNEWAFVAVTRDTAGVANFYVASVLSGTANQDSGTPANGTSNVLLGNIDNSTRTFDGLIDDIRIYDEVISQSVITAIYNGGTGTER